MQGYRKEPLSTINEGLAGTGNQTQATYLAGSITRRSAIHYALKESIDSVKNNYCSSFFKILECGNLCLIEATKCSLYGVKGNFCYLGKTGATLTGNIMRSAIN
jgi:hypothetical protein